MKDVTQSFIDDIRTYGRQFDFNVLIDNEPMSDDNINYIKPAFYTSNENNKISLFTTIMHQLKIDTKYELALNSKIEIEAGVKVNESSYQYINYNPYKVCSCEKQEDTNSFISLAYDRMVEAMIDYDLELYEKITVRNYLIAICNRLGWNTEHIPLTFINYNKLIDPTLHQGVDYTFRMALDEIATITCSFLLFKGEDFYLIYPTETNQTIDSTFLDEDNIIIGERYFINSLVFSRVEESDNIYRKDDESIEENGLHEFKISDNQLLSTNDRDLYIDEMFNYLKTFEFYTFDVQSKGILFLEACDRFAFSLSENTYSTILLNNEQEFEDGLIENLYVDKPGETETEYKYADKTDKRINQTYIMVDKQNQLIQSVVSSVSEQGERISTVEQSVNSISQKVEDIEDVTQTIEGIRQITLNNCVKGDLLELHIYGNNTVFDNLYPANSLYPDDDLYPMGDSRIEVISDSEESSEIVIISTYDLGITEVLRQNEEVCDEYILENGQAKVIRRVNKSGTTKAKEKIEDLGELNIPLAEGTNIIRIKNYTARIKAKSAYQNDYTKIFATKVEMNSSITQTANEINLKVEEKLDEEDFTGANIVLAINNDSSSASINADKVSLER